MAAPNIVNLATMTPGLLTVIPANTALTQLGTTPATGHVWKIHSLVVANVSAGVAATTVSIYPSTNVTGTATRSGSAISVPVNASLVVWNKGMSITIPEGYSIGVTSGTASALEYTMSYDDLS